MDRRFDDLYVETIELIRLARCGHVFGVTEAWLRECATDDTKTLSDRPRH